MHPFEYVAATNVTEVVSLLARHGPTARVMAGGTDLLVQLRADRYQLDTLIDIKGVPEASALSLHGDGLSLGAAVPCYQLYDDKAIATAYPGLIDGASIIGGTQIQSRATLGGNLCNATPSADGICPLIVHSATATLTGTEGTREVRVDDFCTGPGQNAMGSGEFLLRLNIPKPPPRFGAAYQRFTPRNEMDIAVAGVAAAVTLDSTKKKIASARIALAAVGPTPIIATRAAESLVGKATTEVNYRAIGELAAQAATPIDDMRGTVEHRTELVRVLTRRVLEKAVERAKGSK